MSRLHELAKHGQAVWFDFIRRSFIQSGELKKLVDAGTRGVTSNPAIFEKAIAGSSDYDEEIFSLAGFGAAVDEIYESLAIADIRAAADVLRPVYEETDGEDGYVSLEVSPRMAHDAERTISSARRLYNVLDRPNIMIKVPATDEGYEAIQTLIADGINVNATLMFSLAQYDGVAEAYITGLEKRMEEGGDVHNIASVASFFVSRVDSAVDKELEKLGETDMMGKIAVDNARLAYARFKEVFSGPRWQRLADAGARVQRPLWASTGTKNPDYPDTLYVDSLIGPHTVNTVPPATLDAFMDHGTVATTVEDDLDGANVRMARLRELGIDLDAITDKLLADGVIAFVEPFDALLDSVAAKRAAVPPNEMLGQYAQVVDKAMERLSAENVVERIWSRDHTLWSDSPVEIANRLGWLEVIDEVRPQLGRLNELREGLLAESIDRVLLLGMGGSSLAPEVFARTFVEVEGLELSVLDTTVPDAIKKAEAANDPARTLYIVSTKSGGTVETLSLFKYFHRLAVGALGEGEAGNHFVAITDPGSALEGWASELGFRETFLNNPDIGGRYAALSLVGIVPAALMGVNVKKLLERAAAQAVNARPDHGCTMATRLGVTMGALAAAGRDKVTILCSPRVESFGDWAEQLIAESTGKGGKGILPVVGEPLGPPEVYGDDRLFISLELTGDASMEASLDELADAGHPVVHFILGDDYDLGGHFFLWEFATAVAGWLMSIHPFDQPDVESAKAGARAMLDQYKESGALEVQEPVVTDGPLKVYGDASGGDGAAALAGFVDAMEAGQYLAIHAYVPRSEEADEALARLRLVLRWRTRCAVTVGYGPRFLHSTGQLHKGDGGGGRFIQITAEDSSVAAIPDGFGADDSSMDFGVLKLAQAMGDAAALGGAGRKVVRFHTSGDGAGLIGELADFLT